MEINVVTMTIWPARSESPPRLAAMANDDKAVGTQNMLTIAVKEPPFNPHITAKETVMNGMMKFLTKATLRMALILSATFSNLNEAPSTTSPKGLAALDS